MAGGRLEPEQSYVIMANHLSAVDIWALFVALPIRVRMIAKKQLSRIPLFGWAMSAGRFIFIDRANAIAARRSIEEAKRAHPGRPDRCCCSRRGPARATASWGAFKKGGFHLAIDAGVPIVPVALTGTRETMPRGSMLLRAGQVQAIVGEPDPHRRPDRRAIATSCWSRCARPSPRCWARTCPASPTGPMAASNSSPIPA